jgi:hypothetical protein
MTGLMRRHIDLPGLRWRQIEASKNAVICKLAADTSRRAAGLAGISRAVELRHRRETTVMV